MKHDMDPMQGVPGPLLPQPLTQPADPYTIVTDGPRNLADRPFDYRNPFPLADGAVPIDMAHNGLYTPPLPWPVKDDDAGSFDYYWNDNTAIGLPFGPECALVTPRAAMSAFAGCWSFAMGPDAQPIDTRIRRLHEGHIPVITSSITDAHDLTWILRWFAAEVPGAGEVSYPVVGNGAYAWVGGHEPRGRNLFLIAQCTVSHTGTGEREATIHTQFSQSAALCAGAFYTHPKYAPPWERLLLAPDGDDYVLTACTGGQDALLASLSAGAGPVVATDQRNRAIPIPMPMAPAREAEQAWSCTAMLQPQTTLALTWTVPLFPTQRADAPVLLAQEPDRLAHETITLWSDHRARHAQLHIPESKVMDAWTQALNHLDMCAFEIDDTVFPTPGPSGGHHIFYDRDSIDLIYAYDLIGETELAERMIDHYWLRNAGQEESGMVLWLLGMHFRLTQDADWARGILPLAKRCMSHLVGEWAHSRHTNDGLLPETQVGDNELAIGHFVSYHLYAVAGSREATVLARSAGEDDLAESWKVFHEAFRAAVIERLNKLARNTGGVITPTFEGFEGRPVTVRITHVTPQREETPSGSYGEKGGVDWHNIAMAFPTEVLDANDAILTSSLARWRHTYVEGVFPYAKEGNYSWLHNYNTINLSETWLRRGDHAEALRDLYGMLLHTSTSHASAEVVDAARRWDFNCTPHNWFSAKLVRFIRDLLVYEGRDGRLHLLAGLAPAWMQPGMRVGVEGMPTELGPISYAADMQAHGMTLHINHEPRPEARGVQIRLPSFIRDVSIATGQGECIDANTFAIPAQADGIRFEWAPNDLPRISFQEVVKAYIDDYNARAADVHTRAQPRMALR